MGIRWDFVEKPDKKQFNDTGKEGFKSKSLAKKHIKNAFKSFSCVECGSRRLSGVNVLVDITKVYAYSQEEKRGFFGKKIVDSFDGYVFTISDPYLATGCASGGNGWIRCESCGNKMIEFKTLQKQWEENLKTPYIEGEFV